MRLKDKVAIVTGAASGMGAATAELFAREGAKVMLTDLLEDEGMAVVERINKAGGEAQFLRHDVSSDTEWDAVVADTLAAFSRIDVLVNNAGIMPPMRTSKMSADPQIRARILQTVPMRREGRIEEVAAANLFLASDEASYITGIEIPVDGGFLAM